MGRRVLVTGLGSFWGGRVAQALEQDPGVDVIIGLDTTEPTVELERTEYVRTDESYSILSRIVRATQVDTIVHTFLLVDSSSVSSGQMHETNVIGTMNLFAAASQPESRVCNVVVKSSTLVYGSTHADPVWFTETTRRSALPRHRVERSLIEVEGYVRDYVADNPDVTVSMLRFSNVLGEDIVTPITRALDLPVVPCVFGFDPRVPVRARDRRGAGDHVRARPRSRRHVQRRRRRPAAVERGGGDVRQAPGAPAARRARAWRRRCWHASGSTCRPSCSTSSPTGAGSTTACSRRRASSTATRRRGRSGRSPRPPACAGRSAGRAAYRYERDVEQFFRHSPAVVRDQG